MKKKSKEGKERMDDFVKNILPEIQKIYEVKQFEHHFKICVSKSLSFDYYPKGGKIGKMVAGKTKGKYRKIEPISLLKELYNIKIQGK